MSYPVTNSLQIVKELQWVKEVTRGTTPNAPSFLAIPTKSFSPVISAENIKYRKLGSPDLYKGILVAQLFGFKIVYAPIDVTLLKSMINLSGTGNRDDSFTFALSQKHNSAGTLTEMYQIIRGASIADVTLTINAGAIIEVSSNWIASSISDWATTSGLTTPTFAPTLTTTPWSSVTTGSNPLTWNSLPYDVRKCKIKIDQNPDRIQVVGDTQIRWVNATTREISIDMDVVWKDTTLQADTKTLTPRVMSFNIFSTPVTLTFTDAYLEQYDEGVDAESTDAKATSYSGFAASVSIA